MLGAKCWSGFRIRVVRRARVERRFSAAFAADNRTAATLDASLKAGSTRSTSTLKLVCVPNADWLNAECRLLASHPET